MIELVNVSKEYGNGHLALDNVSLKINDGEFVFIVGPSGAGKSTLLKLLMREQAPTSGEIYVGDFSLHNMPQRKVPMLRRSLGIMFQDFRLISDMTVYENLEFAMNIVGTSKRHMKKWIPYVLSLFNLSDKMNSYPDELSGGEQQRVALSRCIINNPKIIIADEPTGNVDPIMSKEIMGLLDEINKRGTTVVVVTHEKNLVNALKKRLVYIKKGKIIKDVEEGVYNV